MAKVAVFYVSCKEDPDAKLQYWVPHMSMIHSRCEHCGALTGYAQVDKNSHYNFYEIAVKKEKGMSYDDCYAKADELVGNDKERYKVADHSDRLDLEGKTSRLKQEKSKLP